MAPIAWAIWLRGLGLMALVGLVVGVLPALRAMRLRVVDALAGWLLLRADAVNIVVGSLRLAGEMRRMS